MTDDGDLGGDVRLGSMLFTLVEPHRGHEVAYNRWYERDHFYAGCMVGPWLFAGRRWVATRALKDLRFGTDADRFGGVDRGSYVAVYWILDEHHDDHVEWALRQVHWLHAHGRMFAERDHVHTLMYRHAFTAVAAGDDAVPAELALDHPFGGLTATLVRPAAGIGATELGDYVRTTFAPELEIGFTPVPLDPDAPVSQQGQDGLEDCLLNLSFTTASPAAWWPEQRAAAERLTADGIGEMLWTAPFIPTVPGTDTHVDELVTALVNPFEHLLAPGRIGSLELPNRIAMSPMGVNLAEPDGTVGEAQHDWYLTRAMGGTGLIIVGSVAVAYPTASFDRRQIAASDDSHLPGLERLVENVHEWGTCIAAQLVHGGTNSLLDIAEGRPLLVPSKKRPAAPDELSQMLTADELAATMAPFAEPTAAYRVQEATDEDLEWVIDRFVESARRVQAAGFDAIELHAGHGYLLHAFLSPHTNRRADRWGGSVERRAELFVSVVRAVREAVGTDFPLWARVGAHEAHREPGQRLEDALVAMRLGLDAGLDAIHVTAYAEPMVATGITDGHTPHEPGALLERAGVVRHELGVPIIAMGRLTPEAADRAIADGHADVIAMGRALIADPYLPYSFRTGMRHKVRPCAYQYKCIGAIFLNEPVQSAVNPDAGHESELVDLATTCRKVVVVGGGPAGLECARRLAERGHMVELWEASDRLGGRLALAERADPDLEGLLSWLIGGVTDEGVEIHLGRAVNGPVDADVVVWAVGTDWGDLDDLRPWLDGGPDPLPPAVTVAGSGKAAVSVALRLRQAGHEVHLAPDDPVLAPELGLPGRFRLVADARAAGVDTSGPGPDGPTVTIRRRTTPAALPDLGDVEVHVIGDATGTGGLAAAFAAAAEVSFRI